MPIHNFRPLRGRIGSLLVDSEHLRHNTLGDPSAREVAIYLPEGYDDGDADYPLMVALAGYTGSGLKLPGWQSFGESVPQRIERLVAEGELGPVVVAFPDCFTSLGGNQYVDSDVLGHWASYLTAELVPRLEAAFRLRRGRTHRAVFGKSSGGYGALYHAMHHADTWGAAASHSGDCGFDLVFRLHLAPTLDTLGRHGGSIERFLDAIAAARKIRDDELSALMTLGMAASFAPDPAAPRGIRLPIDPHTATVDDSRWAQWLAFDPLHMIDLAACQINLRRLAGLFIDCGNRDQYLIHHGTRGLVQKLEAAGIEHVYEEFDDDHSGLDYRMDRSLPFLYRALTR